MEFIKWILKLIIFVSLPVIVEIFANKLQLCHTNPCRNGGDCYRAGDTVEHSNCDDGWTLYRRMCYHLVKSEQSWGDAFRHCRSSQANLLSISNREERKFVKEFMNEELKNSGKYPFNVWTTGKLLSRDLEPVWGWLMSDHNETIEQDDQYWRKDNTNPTNVQDNSSYLPNIWLSGRYFESTDQKSKGTFFWLKGYDKLPLLTYFWNDTLSTTISFNNDACISVSSSTEYSDWVVDNCQEKRNYFLCQKDEPTVIEPNGNYNYQCRCKPGFNGFNCEMLLQNVHSTSQQQICDSEPFQFTCSSSDNKTSQKIVVEYAFYGNLAATTSSGDGSGKSCGDKKNPSDESDCVADNSLLLIAKQCQGQHACSLPAPKRLFTTNPCLPGSSGLTLEYRFRCVEEEQTCPSDTLQHKKACFEILYRDERSDRKSWLDARKYCNSKGGDLIDVIDKETHNLLIGELNKKDDKKVKYFWIGLKMETSDYRSQPTTGAWINGAPLDFMPESSRLEEGDCVAYYVQPPSRIVWLAKNCNYFYNWICQYSLSGPERPKLQDPLFIKETDPTMPTTLPSTFLTFIQKSTMSTTTPLSAEMAMSTTAEGEEETEEATTSTLMLTTTEPTTTTSKATTFTTKRKTARTRTSTTTTAPYTSPFRSRTRTRTTQSSSYVTLRPTKTTTKRTRPVMITRYTTAPPLIGDEEVDTTVHMNIVTMVSNGSIGGDPNLAFGNLTAYNVSDKQHLPQTIRIWSVTAPVMHENFDEIFSTKDYAGNITVNNSFVTDTNAEETIFLTDENILRPKTTTILSFVDTVGEVCWNRTVRNIVWPNTLAGYTATVPCPNSNYRVAFWKCRRLKNEVKFYPETPDLSECRHENEMDNLRDQILSNKEAMEITNNLYEFWLDEKSIYGGDIFASLYMIRDIIQLQNKQLQQSNNKDSHDKQIIATDFAQKMGRVVDIMLSKNIIPIWNDFPREYKLGNVTMLMHNVEDNADLLADYLESTHEKNMTFNSLSMKVEVHRFAGQPSARVGSNGTFLPTSIDEGVVNQYGYFSGADSLPKSTSMTMNNQKSKISIPVYGIISAMSSYPNSHGGLNSTSNSFAHISANDGTVDTGRNPPDLRVGMVEYVNGLSSLLEPVGNSTSGRRSIINSQIVGAAINNIRQMIILPANQLTNITLWHMHTTNVKNARCVYWNTSFNNWDDWGCHVVETTNDYTICSCNHLTSFTILMDVTGALDNISETNKQILNYVTIVGCALSIICLTICIFVFTFFRTLWNERNTIHRNLCICLLIGELLFVCGIDRVQHHNGCIAVAVLLQYFFLAAFSWMLMEGYQLYRMLIKVFEPEKSFTIVYYMLSYGLPAIITAISVGVRFKDYGTDKYCWINVHTSTIWSFAAPVALVVFINIVCLAMALKAVLSVSSTHEKTKLQKMKGWLKGSTMLLSLMGVTWIFGFLVAVQSAAIYFAYIFAFLNSLQGVFIFVFHVILNEKCHSSILRSIRRTFPNFMPRKADSVASNSTGSSNLKKLSDSVKNTNSIMVRPKSPDGKFLTNGNTFYMNQAKFRLNNNFENNLNDDNNFVSNDQNVVPVVVQNPSFVDEANNTSFNNPRQRYAKNPRIIRKETNDNFCYDSEENENFLRNRNNFFLETTKNDGLHVLTIPTGGDTNNQFNNLNINQNQRNNDFVGHF